MIYPTKLDFSTPALQLYDFDDLTGIDSFTIDDKNVGRYIIGFWASTSSHAYPNANIYKDGINLSWKNVNEGFFSYIGPLEKGEYTISTKETSYKRKCMISKSIPEVAYHGDGVTTSTSIPVGDSTGFNYIFIENFQVGYFDSSYSDTFLSNFNVNIVKKDITSINGIANVDHPRISLLKFSEGFGISHVLKKGDVLEINQKTTLSNFNNLKVKIELYGKKGKDTASGKGGNGGYTSFILNSDKIETLSYSDGDLKYGDTKDLYYRIAVAGDGGDAYYISSEKSEQIIGGAGGGVIGGENDKSAYGGRQFHTFNSMGKNGKSGSFGSGGSEYRYSSSRYGGRGGDGWYGGGGGGVGTDYNSTEPVYAGGGGSGFIIGVSTTTYPSGYLGDDTNLQATIASAISEGTLTQGGSTETTPKMVLTILTLPKSSTRNIHYYNGTQFVEAEVYRYNGTLFERVEPKIYTNSQWQ